MKRYDILNNILAEKREVSDNQDVSYLEIGLDHPSLWNFRHVNAAQKLGICLSVPQTANVHGGRVLHGTVDGLVAPPDDTQPTYDVVFVDAGHGLQEVSHDFVTVLNHLVHDGSTVVMHDVLPGEVWHTVPKQLYSYPNPWCGQVWMLSAWLVSQCDEQGRLMVLNNKRKTHAATYRVIAEDSGVGVFEVLKLGLVRKWLSELTETQGLAQQIAPDFVAADDVQTALKLSQEIWTLNYPAYLADLGFGNADVARAWA